MLRPLSKFFPKSICSTLWKYRGVNAHAKIAKEFSISLLNCGHSNWCEEWFIKVLNCSVVVISVSSPSVWMTPQSAYIAEIWMKQVMIPKQWIFFFLSSHHLKSIQCFFPHSTRVQKATTVRVHRKSLSLKIATLSIHLKHPIPGWVKGAGREGWGREGGGWEGPSRGSCEGFISTRC